MKPTASQNSSFHSTTKDIRRYSISDTLKINRAVSLFSTKTFPKNLKNITALSSYQAEKLIIADSSNTIFSLDLTNANHLETLFLSTDKIKDMSCDMLTGNCYWLTKANFKEAIFVGNINTKTTACLDDDSIEGQSLSVAASVSSSEIFWSGDTMFSVFIESTNTKKTILDSYIRKADIARTDEAFEIFKESDFAKHEKYNKFKLTCLPTKLQNYEFKYRSTDGEERSTSKIFFVCKNRDDTKNSDMIVSVKNPSKEDAGNINSKHRGLIIHYPYNLDTLENTEFNHQIGSLAILNNRIYFTDLTNKIVKSISIDSSALKPSSSQEILYESSLEFFFGNGFTLADKNILSDIPHAEKHPCSINNGNCKDLCLPTKTTEAGFRCYETPVSGNGRKIIQNNINDIVNLNDRKNTGQQVDLNQNQTGSNASDNTKMKYLLLIIILALLLLVIFVCVCFIWKKTLGKDNSQETNSMLDLQEKQAVQPVACQPIQMKFSDVNQPNLDQLNASSSEENKPMLAITEGRDSMAGVSPPEYDQTLAMVPLTNTLERKRTIEREYTDHQNKPRHTRTTSNPQVERNIPRYKYSTLSTYQDRNIIPSRKYITEIKDTGSPHNSPRDDPHNDLDLQSASSHNMYNNLTTPHTISEKTSTLGRNTNHGSNYQIYRDHTPKMSLNKKSTAHTRDNSTSLYNDRHHNPLYNNLYGHHDTYKDYKDYTRETSSQHKNSSSNLNHATNGSNGYPNSNNMSSTCIKTNPGTSLSSSNNNIINNENSISRETSSLRDRENRYDLKASYDVDKEVYHI